MRRQAGALRKSLLAVTLVAAALAAGPPTAARASGSGGGVVLDLYGGLHPFGGAAVNTAGFPYWPGWDIARAAAVLNDYSGGWTLDGFGGVHPWGSAPAITALQPVNGVTPDYWMGWDIARDLVVLPDKQSGYILDGFGGVHAFGPNAPSLASPHYTAGVDIARGLAVVTDGSGVATGGWVLDGYGNLYPFGTTPALGNPATAESGRDLWQKLRLTPNGDPYAVAKWGIVNDPGLSPNWSGYADWGSHSFTRDVILFDGHEGGTAQPVSAAAQAAYNAATAMTGGVVLDAFGGIHPFGGAVINSTGYPYWNGWDIARGFAVLSDGSGGWTLDGFGGIHAWGDAPTITASTPYWSGWDIARDLVVLPDEQSGYVLDGYGGVHEFGPKAPHFDSPAYSAGLDYARGLAVVTDGSGTAVGGWVLDGFGSLHAFGTTPVISSPTTYFAGRNVWQKLHLTVDGQPYAMGRFGVIMDPGISAFWQGYPDWGSSDYSRDVQIFNSVLGSGPAQPASQVAVEFFDAASGLRAGVLADAGCNTGNLVPPGGKYIVISVECQRLSAYVNGQLVADTLVTTGRPALPTHEGHTSILRKNHPFLMVSSWGYGSPYWYPPTWVQYVSWIWSDGTGIHDASWEPDSAMGPGSDKGPYASHGCIHVPLAYAQWIYSWADIGTPVDVV